jgi:fermentation-respiration switch protein FrsA (DUF1100 family)
MTTRPRYARSHEVNIRLLSILVAGVVVAAVLLAVIWLGQRRLMYFPSPHVVAPAIVGLPDAESISFQTTDDITLGAWFVPATGGGARGTVIVFNGNAGNRSHRASLASALSRTGFSILLFDYRGYGGNAGTPSETGLIEDARAARTYLAGRPDVDGRRIAYFGESIGTGVAVALAVDEPPAALVLRSPFTSAVDVGLHHYPILPVRWLMRDRFESLDRIRRISSPTLVIAGERDSIVPVSQTRAVFEAARAPKALLIVAGADHNDAALFDGEEMIARVVAFLSDHLGPDKPPARAP